MNVLKNFAKVLSVAVTLAFVANAHAQVWGGIGDNNGGYPGGYPGSYPQPQSSWQQIEEVHFRDGKTAVAIQNCKNARAVDRRCNDRNYQCSACSEIAHSDHSSYIVYQLISGGYPPPPPPPPGHGPGPGPRPPYPPPDFVPEREFVQSYHFYDKQTAVAKQKCDWQRNAMPECRSNRWECTPCTIESHTDHSQFDLYRIIYR